MARLSSPTSHRYGPGYWLIASSKGKLSKETWPTHSEVGECSRTRAKWSVTELVITIIKNKMIIINIAASSNVGVKHNGSR